MKLTESWDILELMIAVALPAAIASYIYYQLTTHPKHHLRRHIPTLKIKRLELVPCLRLHLKHRTIHIHHWMYAAILLLISIPLEYRFLDSSLTRGFLVGGLVQGLSMPKGRRLIYPHPLENSEDYL